MSDPEGNGVDHYGVYIWIESAGRRIALTEKRTYLRINAPSSLNEYHVDDVIVTPAKSKGSFYIPTAEVTISDPVEGVRVYGVWGGSAYADPLKVRATTDMNGVALFEGPRFRNRGPGEVTFTVKMLRKVDSVYNPDPTIKDSDSLLLPF